MIYLQAIKLGIGLFFLPLRKKLDWSHVAWNKIYSNIVKSFTVFMAYVAAAGSTEAALANSFKSKKKLNWVSPD